MSTRRKVVGTRWERVRELSRRALAPIVRKGVWHWVRFALLLVLGSYVGHELSESDRFTDWRYWLYQKQMAVERRGPVYPKYTALVLLNDDDYWSEAYQGRSRLKRDQLAKLLDKLNEAGVNVVAFDVYMDSPRPETPTYEFPDYRAEDEAFYAALGRMCSAGRHVVLATEYWGVDPPHTVPPLVEAPTIYTSRLAGMPCVTKGHINAADDMRKIPGAVVLKDGRTLDSLSLAITHITDPIAYDALVHEEDRGFRFGEFLTARDFSTRDGRQFVFSQGEIQRMDANALRQALADRAVIVGGHWHVAAYNTGTYIDMWNSPGGVEPGTMLHANYVEAMRDPRSTFTPISDRAAEAMEWMLAFVLAFIAALEIHAVWKWLGFAVCFLLSVLLTYALLQNLGLFLDFLIPLIVIVGHMVVEAYLEPRHEVAHLKREVHRAHAKT